MWYVSLSLFSLITSLYFVLIFQSRLLPSHQQVYICTFPPSLCSFSMCLWYCFSFSDITSPAVLKVCKTILLMPGIIILFSRGFVLAAACVCSVAAAVSPSQCTVCSMPFEANTPFCSMIPSVWTSLGSLLALQWSNVAFCI